MFQQKPECVVIRRDNEVELRIFKLVPVKPEEVLQVFTVGISFRIHILYMDINIFHLFFQKRADPFHHVIRPYIALVIRVDDEDIFFRGFLRMCRRRRESKEAYKGKK